MGKVQPIKASTSRDGIGQCERDSASSTCGLLSQEREGERSIVKELYN